MIRAPRKTRRSITICCIEAQFCSVTEAQGPKCERYPMFLVVSNRKNLIGSSRGIEESGRLKKSTEIIL